MIFEAFHQLQCTALNQTKIQPTGRIQTTDQVGYQVRWPLWEAILVLQGSVELHQPWRLSSYLSWWLACKTYPAPPPEKKCRYWREPGRPERSDHHFNKFIEFQSFWKTLSCLIGWVQIWPQFSVNLKQEASSSGGFGDVGWRVPATSLAKFYQGRHGVLSNHLKKGVQFSHII